MSQPNRMKTGGRIIRGRPVTLRFDGKAVSAFEGDTLASALLANGHRVVARSFKYHRPRGVFAYGVEEPNALVQLRPGAWREPNTQATRVEVYDGLDAYGQNAWPSVRWDAAAANQFGAPFLKAGFYYKTFIGPGRGTAFWMLCERFIRKAAGMGTAPTRPDPDTYEKVNAHCDVLVIGGGPAGLAAALSAARSGVRVILAEQDQALGGSLLSEPVGGEGDDLLVRLRDELARQDNIRVLTRTTVFGAYDCDVYGAVERVADHVLLPERNQPRQRYWQIRTRQTILATGAIERPLVFGGNDKPGVMLASAARSYLNRHAVLPAREVVVVTTNDTAYLCAADLARAGAKVVLADARSRVPEGLADEVRKWGGEVLAGHGLVAAKGVGGVQRAVLEPIDGGGRATGPGRTVPCRLVAVSGGWSPVLHLWSQRGRKPRFDREKLCFVPAEPSLETMTCVGAAAGEGSLANALEAGIKAGLRVAAVVDPASEVSGGLSLAPGEGLRVADWTHAPGEFWAFRTVSGHVSKPAFVDLQHDVTWVDLDVAHREGFVSVEHMKRYTTAGMASDQGKLSNVAALARMADLRQRDIADVGTTTFRPPYTPVAIGAIAGQRTAEHFHPTRVTALHDWHAAHGAVFTQAGAWLRPWYYPRTEETITDAYKREAAHVRTHCGIVDVSTLGKIMVQGPDAVEFLNRIYANSFTTLKTGRLRYGVMLRDDGFVMDDGTIARVGENGFLVTTTTANAGNVLAHMEFLLQTSWHDLQVAVTSVSDQWMIAALAGPKARDVLRAVSPDVDVSDTGLPNAHFVEGRIGSSFVRIHRMSYSGELAYEIFVPSGDAVEVWEALMMAGTPHGIAPYGTEAMGTLRIEKGHVAGPEIDGRTTLRDLNLAGLGKKKRPYVGSPLSQRPLLEAPDRPRLVGLEIDGPSGARAGALLFGLNVRVTGHGEGHVTSTTYSPALSKNIALGLLAYGADRMGERIQIVDLVGGESWSARVVSQHFYDPEGKRQNG